MINEEFLRPEMFWDIQFNKLDFQKNRNLIIQRVIDFGTWEEFLKMLHKYGVETVIRESLKSRELSDQGAYFVSHYFNKNIEDFTCYKKRQLSPLPFHF